MKRFIFLAILLIGLSTAYGEEPMAEISFEKTVHNFGTFSEKNPIVTCTFVFTNTGNAPLIINQAIASCGCTVPSYPEKPILPGKKGEIKVTYNATGRQGRFRKIVTIRSSAKSRLARLYIEGETTE